MLPSWRCSDCLFGTVTSPGKPSITGATSNEPALGPIGVLNLAVYTRQTNRVILRIPKSYRIQAASPLSDTINYAISSQTRLSWTKLFFFTIEMFGIPTQSEKSTKLPRQPKTFMVTYDGTFSPHRLTFPVHYGN